MGTRVSSLAPEISDGAFLLVVLAIPELEEVVGTRVGVAGVAGALGAATGSAALGVGVGGATGAAASFLGAAAAWAGAGPGLAAGSISTNLAPTATVSPSAA